MARGVNQPVTRRACAVIVHAALLAIVAGTATADPVAPVSLRSVPQPNASLAARRAMVLSHVTALR